ncbi:Putative integrase [Aromatoleum petrolei]|nr:Putative integrase [Aromatoleum petrolei]
MAYPYSELIQQLQQHFGISPAEPPDTPSAIQQYRNHLSALNGFLAVCGKTVEGNVGAELGSHFDTRLREYVETAQLAPRTKRDRITQLKAIQRIYQKRTARTSAPRTTRSTSLSIALREAIALTGHAPKTLAREIGISPATVRRWLNGAGINRRGVPSLHRLEKALGLARDTLVSLAEREAELADGIGADLQALSKGHLPVVVPSFRRRLADREPHGLTLAESDLNDDFLREWHDLFQYKTGGTLNIQRTMKGTWRLIPANTATRTTHLARRRNMVCPSAEMFMDRLRTFFGVLFRLPAREGGFHWSEPPSQTLAWLAHPDALTLYLDWLTDRSDGIRHSGQRVFSQFVASLLRPETGYLWQQAARFREQLPREMRPADDDAWRAMCERSHTYLRQFIRGAKGVSRAPDEPIANLLALPNPLKPVLNAIELIDATAAACPPGSISEARHKRNALLLAMLLSNPLRRRSIASLTWEPNGHGSLRGSAASGWRIVLAPHQLKNGDSNRGRNYDVKVADWLNSRLSEYLEEYRDTLLNGGRSRYLFIGDETEKLWEGLGTTVRNITRRYIPGSPGFGPHALRHLVATDWLRRFPGDFLTVAELLNDRLETVLASYAHLKRDDSFSRYEAHIATMI